MTDETPSTAVPALNARERRVLGVLVEKQKTTPEYYPMTIAAIVTACNQKSNRDPVTNYDADDVEEILDGLRKRGAAVILEGSGRVPKWKHTLYDWLELKGRAAEMAVLAELLLRGPQTEGDLRGRAGRMDEIPDLSTLQTLLQYLSGRGLVVTLSPPGQKRGVVVTHGLYPPEELERIRASHANSSSGQEESGPARSYASASGGTAGEVAALRAEIEELKSTVATLSAEFREFKAALGA
jgi:uncharacterized protein YceH (UPF0502 family)